MRFTTFCFAAVAAATAHATVVTTEYDAFLNTLPQAQGFTMVDNLPQGINTPTVSSGLLHVNAYDSPATDASLLYFTDSVGTISFSSFVAEANLDIVASSQRSSPGNGNFPRAGYVMSLDDSAGKVLQLFISDTGLWMQSSGGGSSTSPATSFLRFNTTGGFHTYRVQTDGTNANLYIDHAITAALTFSLSSLVGGGSPNVADFGDSSDLARSRFDLQYYLFSSDVNAQAAPEPGTLGLLASFGVLCFMGKGSSRKGAKNAE